MRFKKNFFFFSKPWKFILLFPFLFIFSCVHQDNHQQPGGTLPTAKWTITQLKDGEKLIVFDTSRIYFLEFAADNNFRVNAEDNQLSGDMIAVTKENFTLDTLTITDVCCNSDEARLLFNFFKGTIHYHQTGRQLVLSSGKTVVVLER